VDKRKTAWKVLSIKNNNVELLHAKYFYPQSTSQDGFVTKLAKVMSAPRDQLRVTWNEKINESSLIVYPWEFSLSRIQPDENE
jgi:hypothetical protein